MRQLKLPNGRKVFALDKMTAIDVYKEIFVENVYLRAGIDVQPGAVVMDVGANIGLFSLFVLDKVPDAKIFMFEPIPQIFEVLQANYMQYTNQNNISNGIKQYNIGLSDHEGTAEFFYYPRVCADSTATPFVFDKQVQMFLDNSRKGIARLVPDKIRKWFIGKGLKFIYSPEKVTCPLKTMSQIIAENQIDRIDLLKLDAENAERGVVDGINSNDWEKIRQITMEVHTNIPGGETLVPYLIHLLESKGFTNELDTHARFSSVGVHMLYSKK